jgi:FixJ family two-component response regulator
MFSSQKRAQAKVLQSAAAEATDDAYVAVVDDDERVCKALSFQLGTVGFEVVGYSSADDLLSGADASRFDCVVADIFLPRINGIELQERLRKVSEFASVVFVTGRGDFSIGMQAMRAGALDVLEKPVDEETLIGAIRRGVQISRARRAGHSQRVKLEERYRSLPNRQRQVFKLITAGLLNKQVAADLGISERTVKVHRERLRQKMGADSVAELSRMAEALRVHSDGPHLPSTVSDR